MMLMIVIDPYQKVMEGTNEISSMTFQVGTQYHCVTQLKI